MAGRQAKILSENTYKDLLVFAATTRHPIRNQLIVLLSLKAGLRAGEIAKLTWDMVLDPNGAITTVIELRDRAAKKGSGRLIPIHPELRELACYVARIVRVHWARYHVRTWRADDANQYRQLVCQAYQAIGL